MKKVYSFLIIFSLFCIDKINAQLLPPNQPEQDACDALRLCGNTFTSTYSYQLTGLVNDLSTTPCGAGEGNSMWLLLDISTAGSIVFTISPLNLTDDYDFAVVDITNSSCSTFTSNDVIRCNFNNNQPGSNPNGVVGLNTTSLIQFVNAGAFGSSFLQQINANAGDKYLIMINNFGDPFAGGPSSGFTIDFTGSTAIFNDNGNPTMLSVIQQCTGSQQIMVPMSENVLCSSIEPSGSDFVITGGGVVTSATGVKCSGANGYTDTLIISFSSPLAPGNYTLSIQNGSDGNTLLDLCNHPVLIPDQLQFTVANYAALEFQEIIPPSCKEIKLKMTSRVDCDFIAPNGSDFIVTGPQPVSIAGAYGVSCNGGNFTDTILLVLGSPLITDGTYTVTSKNGGDGNTQIDSCGLLQATGDAISFSINSYDGLVTAMPDTLVCNPGYIPMYASDNSIQPATYRWSPGVFLNDSTQLQTVGYIAQDIVYTILAIDQNGCPHRDKTTITLSERQPSLVPLEETICRGNDITLNAYGGKTYNWISLDVSTLSCNDCPSPVASPYETMVYSVSISDENNCSDTLSTTITVNQLPNVVATPNDTTVLYDTDLQLAASGAMLYTWIPNRYINYPNTPAPIATIKEPVIIVVTGIDENGCSNRDSIRVGVNYNDVVVLPSAFTPNGDGKNDIFMLGSLSFQRLEEFRIFNRWGQELFHTINPKEGWDGSYKGQPQDMGVYGYIIRVAYPNGKVDTYKGDVTLVR